jgi:hypothetical protein
MKGLPPILLRSGIIPSRIAAAQVSPARGGLASSAIVDRKPDFIPESTAGGRGDKLHPNRAGYLAMGQAIDLGIFGVGQ